MDTTPGETSAEAGGQTDGSKGTDASGDAGVSSDAIAEGSPGAEGGDGGCGPISTGNGTNCDHCAAAHCCGPYEACANSTDCIAYADCLNACAVDAGGSTPDGGPCFDGCGAAHPTGAGELNAYEGCLFGAYCYYACTN
ncbi:MAG: hypothetical protein ACRELB_09180 [Polyangiaceae bacterium]